VALSADLPGEVADERRVQRTEAEVLRVHDRRSTGPGEKLLRRARAIRRLAPLPVQ
jgi:hypothetical protein